MGILETILNPVFLKFLLGGVVILLLLKLLQTVVSVALKLAVIALICAVLYFLFTKGAIPITNVPVQNLTNVSLDNITAMVIK